MIKEEFNTYLNGFNKEAGEFTEDELYEIGCKYKELPISEKRWNELVELLGIDKSGEQFRLWIKNKQAADGTLPKNIQLLSGQTINDLSFDEAQDKIEELKVDLYKQQVKTRDTLNTYRRAVRGDARAEHFTELLAESIEKYPQLPKVASIIQEESNVEAVMLLSDLHMGMEINNYFNKYNVEIATKRFNTYIDEVIRLCRLHNVQRLNVCNLGDAIHGIIHITGRIESQTDVIEQVMLAAELFAQGLNKLQSAAPEVIYRSVTDNHSRVMANFKENIEQESLTRLIDFYLKPRLANTNIIFAEDNLDYDISFFELMNGKKMICSHGHHDGINTAIQGYLGATKQFIDYVCIGHYHESKMKSFQGAKVFVNGSICGSDSYAQSKRLYGDPEQTLLIFTGNTLSINSIDLNIK